MWPESSWICGRIFRIILATLLCYRGLKCRETLKSPSACFWIILKPESWGFPPVLFWLSLFVLLSSPQLCHNIQRARAHNPGCKHTRGSEVVQQQPRTRDAYELARLWGMTRKLLRRAREGRPPWLLMAPFALSSLSHTPGIQPRPGQRSPKEEETRRSPTHSEHWPCSSTWWSQQVSSMDALK